MKKILALFLCAVASLAIHCSESDKPKDPKAPVDAGPPITEANKPAFEFKVFPATDEGEMSIKKFKLDKDLKCELFAAEPLVANIVAFSIDEKGRFYVAETFRVGEGVIDNRGHMDWLDEDLNSRSVDDRYAFQSRHLGANTIKEMGIASERIKLVEDRAGKGKADFSSVYATGFDSILDGVAAGILARKGSVYLTNIPNLWLLKDTKGAGYATERKSLHYGYGIRNAFMGHDLHGLKMGPDYRLYFSMGDRGAHIKTEGHVVDNQDSGCVFRCNPDGSNLEVYHTGLRNPQSLAFDRYGNLFTGDNNADSGDKSKWFYIVEGGDSGWRIGWQYIKSPALGAYNTEKMWWEPCPEQPRYILPACGHICAGPSGLVYYPGTGLPDRYKEHFFICDFTGGPTAKVHSFKLNPRGASFEMIDRSVFQEGCLVTDLCFGVNGGLYMSDWVEGWTKTGKGRIYRVFEEKSAAEPIVGEVKKILADGFENRNIDQLIELLGHIDMRVRQEAEFELVDRAVSDPTTIIKALENVLPKKENQSARLHAIWALEIIARKKPGAADVLVSLLNDGDPVIKGQAAKMLGERRVQSAEPEIAKLLQDKSSRVRFHATNALGKIGQEESLRAIFPMLREAGDKDAYLRHAGVMALVWMNDFELIKRAAKDAHPAVRMAALLAMRKLERPEIGQFCADKEPDIVLEAARAINDLPISGALPELAALISKPTYNEPLMRRTLNANYRLGTEESAKALANFALQDAAPPAMRAEALNMLGEWAKPGLRDRITNLFRPIQGTASRDAAHAAAQVKNAMNEYIKSTIDHVVPDAVRTAGVQACDKLNINEALPLFFDVVNDGGAPGSTRVAALKALAARNDPKLAEAVRAAAGSQDYNLRKEGLALLGKISAEEAAPKLSEYVERQILDNKRFSISTVAEWQGREPEKVIAQYMDAVLEGRMEKELILDVLQAAEKKMKDPAPPEPKKEEPKKDDKKKDDVKKDEPKKVDAPVTPVVLAAPVEQYVRPDFKAKLDKYESMRDKNDLLAPFKETLYGGNADAGRKIFMEKTEVGCVRCHKIGNKGTEVGPNLTDLALRMTKREYYLESIVDPNKVIAPGFESAMVKTKDGMRFSGVVKKDDAKELILSDGTNFNVIQKDNIEKRVTAQSPMPQDLVKQLNKNELRDLIEFLASQRTPLEKPKEEDSKHQ